MFTSQIGWIGADVLQDIARADIRSQGELLDALEDRRRLRDELLARLGATWSFAAGSVLMSGPDGRPDARPAYAAVTPDEVVLLSGDVMNEPEVELARIPRAEIVGVRVLDQFGDPVPEGEMDPVAELDGRPDARYVVWVDRSGPGANAFAFLAPSVARECARRFERVMPETAAP